MTEEEKQLSFKEASLDGHFSPWIDEYREGVACPTRVKRHGNDQA